MPMITMAIIASISVNPEVLFCLIRSLDRGLKFFIVRIP